MDGFVCTTGCDEGNDGATSSTSDGCAGGEYGLCLTFGLCGNGGKGFSTITRLSIDKTGDVGLTAINYANWKILNILQRSFF